MKKTDKSPFSAMLARIPFLAGRGAEGHSHLHNWLALMGSLFLAFLVWLFVMSTDAGSMGEFTDIPVRIQNESSLSILSGDELAVDLKVEGKRSVISNTVPSDIDVSITIDPDTRPGRYSYELSIQLPGGLRLVESSLTKVMLYLDNTTLVTVPVEVKLTDYILPDSYEIDREGITTGIQSVAITGPESLLQTVECAQVKLSLGTVTRSVTCIGALTLVDQRGDTVSSSYIRMAQSEVSVTIPVYKYRTISPTILFEHGYFNDSNVRITCEPAAITIKGEADAVDRVTWTKTINEKTVGSDTTFHFSIGFNEDVTVVEDIQTVAIRVEHLTTEVRSIQISGFRVINSGGRLYELVDKYITVTFRGDSELIQTFTAGAVRAEVDLSHVNASQGTVTAPVTITILGGFAGNVWEIGSYEIMVRFEA